MRGKRTAMSLAAAAALVAGPLTGTAAAHQGHDHTGIPPHPHMKLIGVEFLEEAPFITYRKCVNLAGGRILSLDSQHAHIHFGRAGEAWQNAGHLVVPGAPAFGLPFSNCAELADFIADLEEPPE